MERTPMPPEERKELIKALLANRISLDQLNKLRESVDQFDLAQIIQHIYDLNQRQVNRIAALDKMLAWIDAIKNTRRNKAFTRKIASGFRGKAGNIVVLAEGDSWFNYPILLSDILDWVGMEPDIIVYSLAEGGDWLLNMLSARKYVEQLSVIHPDFYLISAGGNDLVGKNRLAAMIDATGTSDELDKNPWATGLIERAKTVALDKERFDRGKKWISKDFYALLMFFNLQYTFMIGQILLGGKFPGIRVITQGYDYAVPSRTRLAGVNPLRWYRTFIRLFLGHGGWLKTPLQLRGIQDERLQGDIVYAMIYLFNEMMIFTGEFFCDMDEVGTRVFHVDSRGSVSDTGWSDELHPLPGHFRKTGRTFVDCIRGRVSDQGQVYVVKNLNP